MNPGRVASTRALPSCRQRLHSLTTPFSVITIHMSRVALDALESDLENCLSQGFSI